MKLKVDQLSLRFGESEVLRRMSAEISETRVLAVVGPSGGGKSTLLRVLSGLLRPDEGQVLWSGGPMSFREKDLLAYRRRVGTVFQAFNLFPHLSALANITLPLVKVHGCSPEEARQRAETHLNRFQLLAHAGKKPGALSGGQRQRVAIARAMAIQPELLFFDEPTSALDPEMTYEVLEAIREVREEDRDLVLVTHEIGFAREVADELWFLHDGKILETGPPQQVIDQPRTEEAQRFFERILRW
ncbi:amino acid ABC transporter ATP-binding protein [Puniceicoccus vermicola]|uniref:Amino acid ABC transporter ATP-binding protein n=1 Tax=Puniceicoccus vermicola TaxID=388746 RepID=A0A7X1AXY5_9BACT|nr:amino acid ABC transporter ATP-binding protein [Puniceicoccus vermicola]MBC2602026.1 amino acid ABC transporter ATP-binding protein [Puniceicoccus vermicola]